MQDFIQPQGQPQPEQVSQNAAQVAVDEAPPAAPEMIGPQQGVPQGTGLAQIEQAPWEGEDQPVGDDEQKEYEDLFLRVMAAVHDVRTPPNGRKSMADYVIQNLATKGQEPHVSIGGTAGMLMFNMNVMAKRQNKKYSPDVLREVGMDLVYELYQIADKSGAIENLPPEDSQGGEAIIKQSAYEAVKIFGEQGIQTGQFNQQEHMKELQHQMQREADNGELDDWGMEEFDEESRFQLAHKMRDITNGS